MATFKAVIRKDEKRADRTWNVLIRVLHNRKARYIKTSLFVDKNDLTSTFKIKNRAILDKCEEIVTHYRKLSYQLNLDVNDVSLEDIVEHIQSSESNETDHADKDEDGDLSFTEFFYKWKDWEDRKGWRNYQTAVRAFARFLGKDEVFMKDVTALSV